MEGRDLRIKPNLAFLSHDPVHEAVPHHARTELRIGKLLYQAFCLLAAKHGIGHGDNKGQPLDTLGRPVGSYLTAWYSPDLLGIGFEKRSVKSCPETVGDPFFEAVLFSRGENPGPAVAGKYLQTLHRAKIEKGVGRPQRIVEVFTPVIDARQPLDRKQIIAEQFLPEAVYIFIFGEKPVTADIKIIILV